MKIHPFVKQTDPGNWIIDPTVKLINLNNIVHYNDGQNILTLLELTDTLAWQFDFDDFLIFKYIYSNKNNMAFFELEHTNNKELKTTVYSLEQKQADILYSRFRLKDLLNNDVTFIKRGYFIKFKTKEQALLASLMGIN